MTDPKFDLESEIPTTEVPVWARGMSWTGWCVKAVAEHGCAGGTYMPAVTYHEALATMLEHGDDIFELLDDGYGGVPVVTEPSWAAMACRYVSMAVESWAGETLDRIESGEFDPQPSSCPDCDWQRPASQEGHLRDCRRCNGTGEVYS